MSQLLSNLNKDKAPTYHQCPSVTLTFVLSLLSQNGGCVKRVAVEGRFLATSGLALAGPEDCGGRQLLPSTPGPCLHSAAGLCLHSLQICLWEVRLGDGNMKVWAWPELVWCSQTSKVCDCNILICALTLPLHFNTMGLCGEVFCTTQVIKSDLFFLIISLMHLFHTTK